MEFVRQKAPRIWARLRRAGTRVSEKVVRRVMREEGLEVVYNRRRRHWSSYAGEISEAPGNLVGRDFRASAPDELWLTDITEFRAGPDGPKAYLSAVVDCFDGKPVAWSVGPRPDAELANSSLLKALAQRRGAPRRWSTATAARTTAGRVGFRSARSTGWPGACRRRGAARTTRPARASSAG